MGLDIRRAARRGRGGFTLVEVLIATALLGFSLVVMFGFHAQAARSSAQARKITACTYLAQTQLEQLLAASWSQTYRPTELSSPLGDTTTSLDAWADLPHPGAVTLVNAANSTDTSLGQPIYRVTWSVEEMDTEPTWLRVRVRCTYWDQRFATFRGTTISSYRYRDD
jgi:prepilin-type N-terminal cleavage/methylation domain-containing protein